MSQSIYRIPRQSDSSLIQALALVRQEMAGLLQLRLYVQLHEGGAEVQLSSEDPLLDPQIADVICEASEVMPRLYLRTPQNKNAVNISRNHSENFDSADCKWDQWGPQTPEDIRTKAFVKLQALVRKHLRVSDLDASLTGLSDNAWGKYRQAQLTVVNSLQETQKSLLVEFNRKVLETTAAAKVKEDETEKNLRESYAKRMTELEAIHEDKMQSLLARESALKAKADGFETKEARYVARQKQDVQMKELQERLKSWGLTPATQRKRWWVKGAYISALIVTGILTWTFNAQNMDLLKQVDDISKLLWWQWLLLGARSVVPATAFVAFMIYFIRWSTSWAKQHAEEEFLTHARVLDIGRSAWLLEAVRDSQDHNQPFPEALLKELSRNLFTSRVESDPSENTPKLAHELMLQGLSSVRVKTADGSEFEASRTKKG